LNSVLFVWTIGTTGWKKILMSLEVRIGLAEGRERPKLKMGQCRDRVEMLAKSCSQSETNVNEVNKSGGHGPAAEFLNWDNAPKPRGYCDLLER
jgi:hypothetical protein